MPVSFKEYIEHFGDVSLEWAPILQIGIKLKDQSSIVSCDCVLTIVGMESFPVEFQLKQGKPKLLKVPIKYMQHLNLGTSQRQVVGEVKCKCTIAGYIPTSNLSWNSHNETVDLQFLVNIPVNMWDDAYCSSHLSNRKSISPEPMLFARSIGKIERPIKKLLNEINDSQPIIWFHGRPGIGKTHLAGNLEEFITKDDARPQNSKSSTSKRTNNFQKIIPVVIILDQDNIQRIQSLWQFWNLIDKGIWDALSKYLPQELKAWDKFAEWENYFSKSENFYKFSHHLDKSRAFTLQVKEFLLSLRPSDNKGGKKLLIIVDGFYYFLKESPHLCEVRRNLFRLIEWVLHTRRYDSNQYYYPISLIVTDVIPIEVRLRKIDPDSEWMHYLADQYGDLLELVNEVCAEAPHFLPTDWEIEQFLEKKSLIERGNFANIRKILVDRSKRFPGELSEMIGCSTWLYVHETSRNPKKNFTLSTQFATRLVEHYYLSGFITSSQKALLEDLISKPIYNSSSRAWATTYTKRGETTNNMIISLQEKSILDKDGRLAWRIGGENDL